MSYCSNHQCKCWFRIFTTTDGWNVKQRLSLRLLLQDVVLKNVGQSYLRIGSGITMINDPYIPCFIMYSQFIFQYKLSRNIFVLLLMFCQRLKSQFVWICIFSDFQCAETSWSTSVDFRFLVRRTYSRFN